LGVRNERHHPKKEEKQAIHLDKVGIENTNNSFVVGVYQAPVGIFAARA
jgi:hypothetical protein